MPTMTDEQRSDEMPASWWRRAWRWAKDSWKMDKQPGWPPQNPNSKPGKIPPGGTPGSAV